jgi:hypothetical protein
MTIETHFDIPFISSLALRERQNHENVLANTPYCKQGQ